MVFKELEIQGFKSFPDKVKITFDEGVTGVVGPNGSGKSNLSDAVRWVLRETSARQLRPAGKMEDVIFGGTRRRGAMGFAQVRLTLDNSSHALDVEADEVTIGRRYYRSGESEYSINGQICRLKDVYELLLDTGIGRDGYSVIGQGRIAEIVAAKSSERREIFEEACGIAKYRYRKNEAERRLAAAAENLERLRDILGELEARVGPLEKESEKARKFLELSARRKTLEALDAALTASEAELAALADADTRRVELEAEAARLAQRETALNELARSLTECQHRNTAARAAQEAYRQAAGRQTEAHSARDTLERAFLDAQAGLLAQTLEEGAACPVCGSTHHPAKAHLPRTAPTEVQVNQAKQAAAQADSAAQEASAAAREALTREQEGRAQLRKDAEALLPERFTSPEGPVPLTVSLLKTALAEENDALHTAQADLKQRQTKNHTDCRRKKELEAQRKAQAEQRTALEAQVTAAQQAAAAAQAAVQTLEARQAAEQTAQPQKIEALKAEQNELLTRRRALAAQEKGLNARLLPNRRALADHRKLSDQRDALDARWQWVNALASTAGGTLSSKQKIRLEAYIQMNYLDRILVHANTRLMQMTAGQYELERIGAENQRSQSGLDLGVIDHYNGTRRSVKTLSGGESFKASLALALGLSDEVQSTAGGIRLDTLFLDEGFGSLDEESLEQAIRVLSGLTEGDRLVGIISHVAALKDRIDRQVIVHKERSGGSWVEIVT